MATFVFAAALLWGVPTGLAFLLRPERLEHQALFPVPQGAQVDVVGERSDDGSQPATLKLSWEPPLEVKWPANIGGIVTALMIRPGDVIGDGTSLASVNGITRLAQTSGTPMYRTIAPGASGSDVIWLDGLLIRMGFASKSTLDPNGVATAATGRAVSALERRIGAPQDGEFRPEYAIWAGQSQAGGLTVGVVDAALGSEPGASSPIFRGTSHLVDAQLTLSAPPTRQTLLHDTPITLTIGTHAVQLSGLNLTSQDMRLLEPLVDVSIISVEDATVRRATLFRAGAVPSWAIIPVGGNQGCVVVMLRSGTFEPRKFALPNLDSLEPGVSYVPQEFVGLTIVTNFTPELYKRCSSD